ncbi:Amidase enhancer [hydrothermal vent metagenome]|uniref:Amidase enhancer n=1 Tax=hydrothermal vent metagenome TaxID=652676 RepID=A0A3B0TWC3_9ZZZZ
MGIAPKIDVGIMSSDTIEFFFDGGYKGLESSGTLTGGFTAIIVNNNMVVQQNGVTILAGKEIFFEPIDFNISEFELKDVTIGVNFHWEQKENQRFQGALKLIIEQGKITAINILSLEDYLISVISSEMKATSSLELLKSHAIISRSWLIAQIEKQESLVGANKGYESTFESEGEFIRWYDREDHKDFHVCADDHCQRYQGTTRSNKPGVVKAVNQTRGVILSYNGQICDARFSKCCGGVAELFENCWEPVNHPYLTKVIDNPEPPKGFDLNLEVEGNAERWMLNSPDAFCNTNDEEVLKQVLNEYDRTAKDFYRWKVEYTQGELSHLILKRSGYDFGQITDLTPVERGVSGRLIKLKVVGSKKTLIIGKELEIRRWLSESHLYSSAFVVEKKGIENGVPGKFILHGAGWGHGVGLCQIGAAVMGHKGYRYDDILHHYFKDVSLEKRY